MQIAGIQKTTLVDFPGKVAATIFTRGCTFRCGFCHNPELVLPEKFIPLLDENELFDFFQKRAGKLQGVCITGGEPTMQKDLPQFIKKLKDLGYAVKLDSNGSLPDVLEKLIAAGNIDYIAMDIKAAPSKYLETAGIQNSKIKNQNDNSKLKNDITDLSFRPREHCRTVGEIFLKNIQDSIFMIQNSGLDYEFRTTVCHPLHEVADFGEIGQMIKGTPRYFIQNFVRSKHNDETTKYSPFSDEELEKARITMKKYVGEVEIR